MSAKISKEDTDRMSSGRFLLAALERQGPYVVSILNGLAARYRREDDPEPGFHGTVVALARRLEAAIDGLDGAGHELYAADAELTVLRVRRDDWTGKLARAIVRLRRKTLGDYVAPDLGGLALHSPRLYRAHPLLRQIETIDACFHSDDVAMFLGEPAYDDVSDPLVAVGKAREIGDELEAVMDQINDGRRRHDEALIARDKAREEYDTVFLHTARTFEEYCRLAGLDELARRVRPSVKRPGRFEEEPNEEDVQAFAAEGKEASPEDAEPEPPAVDAGATHAEKAAPPVHVDRRPSVGRAPSDDSAVPVMSQPSGIHLVEQRDLRAVGGKGQRHGRSLGAEEVLKSGKELRSTG